MTMLQTINPTTEEVLGEYALMNKSDVENLIQEMNTTQKQWIETSMAFRKKCILNVAKILRDKKNTYAKIITDEMGKPIQQSLAEIEKCVRLCGYYAEMSEKFLEPELIQTEFYKSYRSFHPIGIIFAIMPWNFPFWQVMRFAVPNLMLGNAGLLKHAPNTTGAALAIEQLFFTAGFPKELFRSLVIDVNLVPFVIQHSYIAGVTMTGSNNTGKSVAKEAGAALKKVVLELGGSDPYVILEDADLELAAEQCVISRLNNSGQVCISAKRLIVVEKVKQQFIKLVLDKAKAYVMGDPNDSMTKLGPMARDDLRIKLHDQVERSIKSGARCVLGGVLSKGKGYYYPATVLLDVTPESPAFHEELFGPVICITSAKNETEALHLANQTEFGLGAAVFTRDLKKGEDIARKILAAGTCAVNVHVSSDPRLPFGGIKQSGYGRELSVEGIREFANIKTVIVASTS